MLKPLALAVVLVCVLLFVVGDPLCAQNATSLPQYEVYALRYAVIPQFPVSDLVAGADPSRKLDIAMIFWVIKGGGHTILFDSGFYREQLVQQWKLQDYIKPSDAVKKLDIQPEDVTDIIISHAHWDHSDGVDLFPKAQTWIQKDEYTYYTGEAWQLPASADLSTPEGRRAANSKHGGIEPADMMVLVKANLDGRLHFVNGDDQQVLPGIRCYIGGKHTFQSQFCTVNTRSGTVVLASDNMYLYENLEKHAPIAQTLDAQSNLRAQDRMKQLASNPKLIVPGHDPGEFDRFPKVTDGVVRID